MASSPGTSSPNAAPTLFDAGAPSPQTPSCSLATVEEDSIDGIYDTLKDCAVVSKYAGGIGIGVSGVRASRSYVHGTNGTSDSIVPMLRVFSNTARCVDQGGGWAQGLRRRPRRSPARPHLRLS